jgi:hypothetical protein
MSILADDELAAAATTELIARFVADGLEAELPAECAADLERLALSMQQTLCWPDAPPELAHTLVRELARRGDELAAGMLTGIERLASEPLAGLAAAEARRLADRGVASPYADAIGRVDMVDAHRLEVGDGAAEIWFVLLGRQETDDVQPMTVFVEHESWGSLIAGASLGEPMAHDIAGTVLESTDGEPSPVEAEALTRSLQAALDAMVRNDVALDPDAGRVLPLLERALTGHAGRLPRPPAEEPDPEEAGRAAADMLVETFAEHLEDMSFDPELIEHAPFVAHTMLEWKLDYADGELLRWDIGDLREYLMDWFPRKVTCDAETIPLATAAVAEFLRFLDAAELLAAPVPLKSLTSAVKRLSPAFERAARDPGNWGHAKRLALQMLGDGIDMEDPEAAQEWIEEYNARLSAERYGPPARPATDVRRRKAARQARKRNRR